MSWAMPTAGQWTSGVAMTPDMNMGNYTPEQWTAMQQQNWQQWAQWQQQYAQWQTQYGEKYAQQMQAMQAMGGMPPLPPGGTSVPPPPPDKPPPPPPHENNQPLYGNTSTQPVPVPPPTQRNVNSGYNNSNFTGNNQSWSQGTADSQQETSQAVNAEALKKLAEEERLFDIQFQKWEEEIEKWKKENVNHPDKTAYKEYEAKFEACRVQLLERRHQMKQRRAKLLGNTPQPANTAPQGNNKQTSAIPSLMQTPVAKPSFNQNVQPHHKQPSATPNYPNKNNTTKQYNDSQNQYKDSQNQYNNDSQNQYNNDSQAYNRSSNKSVDPQDRYEAYNTMEDYSSSTTSSTNFLPASTSAKGIPGLDLVPESDKPAKDPDVIDITEENTRPAAPDYSTISKGINNILGDEKIMNILSMVRVTTAGGNNNTPNAHSGSGGHGGPIGPSATGGHGGPGGPMASGGHGGPVGPMPSGGHGGPVGPMPSGGHGGPVGPSASGGHGGPIGPSTSGVHGGPSGPSALGGPSGHNMQSGNFGPGAQSGSTGYNMGPGGSSGSFGPNTNNYNMQANNQWDRNDNQPNQYNNQQYGNNQNMQNFNRPPPLIQQNQNPPMQNRMYNDGQRDMPQDQYYDRNPQFGAPNMGSRPPAGRPNMPPGRPPLQEMPGHQNMNDQYRGRFDNNSGMHDNRGMHDGRGMHDDRAMPMHENQMPMNQPPPRPKWVEEPLFTPSIIVEYEHKPLRLKAREFIEPVHTFDYNHISKDDEYKKKDFEREVDDLFTRKPRRLDDDYASMDKGDRFSDRGDRFSDRGDRFSDRGDRFPIDRGDRFAKELPHRDFERRPREEIRPREEDFRPRVPRDEFDDRRREEYEERRRVDSMFYDRRRDDRDKFSRRDDYRDREEHRIRDDLRDRDRDRYRDVRREEPRQDLFRRDDSRREDTRRSRSRERDIRKRGRSRESEASGHSKKSKESEKPETPKHVVMIDDILESPGREMRPEKIVIILRGPPGSGKSYLAKLIRDREAEYGGTARIMSIDDYFVQEGEVEEKDPSTGKIVKKPTMKYEYDESLEETYITSLKRAFKRSITDGYFSFLIYDAVNDQLKSYADIWNFARQNGFQVYIITMELDPQICYKRNIHNRSLSDIEVICTRFFPTPAHHITLDATTLLQSAAIPDVTMEDATDEVVMEDNQDTEVETTFTSKWEKMDDVDKLARLDGTSKPLRPKLSMEDYLQIDDWKPNQAKPGKKTVRWADIEERRQQEKMRAIGFVVGQTDWNRMTDPTMGSSALTQTKYIERVRRN